MLATGLWDCCSARFVPRSARAEACASRGFTSAAGGVVQMRRRLCSVLVCFGLLAVGCSQGPAVFEEQVIGNIASCSPAPDEPTMQVYSIGGWELEDGSSLSEVSIGQESPTGFDGEVSLALVSTDEFSGAVGIPADQVMDFSGAPSTVEGPGTIWVVLTIEVLPEDHMITFKDLRFTIDEEAFVSNDTHEFEIAKGGCA